MKSKNNTILKILLTFVAISMALLGVIGGLISSVSNMNGGITKKYYEQHPLNEKNGIVVDSEGNIYIGGGLAGIIQVYDSTGKFKYGFIFPTNGGWFDFGIQQDKIHIVTARTDSYFIFDRGELVYSEKGIDYNRSQELQSEYNMTESNSFFTDSKTYKILPQNTVSIEDKLNVEEEQIHLNVPKGPVSFKAFYTIGFMGLGLIFILHYEFFLLIFNRTKRN